MNVLLSLVLMLAANGSGQDIGKLTLSEIRADYGQFGPERPSLQYYQRRDVILFRFLIGGIMVNGNNQGELETEINIISVATKEAVFNSASTRKVNLISGGSLVGHASAVLNGHLDVGNYEFNVTVKDMLSKKVAGFTRKVEIRKEELAIVMPRIFYDKEHRIPASSVITPGQAIYFQADIIGLGPRKKLDLQCIGSLYGGENNKQLVKEQKNDIVEPNVTVVPDSITLSNVLELGGPGSYVYVLSVTDRLGLKRAVLSYQVRVVLP